MYKARIERILKTFLFLAIVVSPAICDAQEVKSYISGECDCDSVTKQTVCIYTVISGIPALSHIIMPIAPNCADYYEITSPFFDFDSAAQLYKDQFCGEVFGVKANQSLAEGQVTTITITYDQCYRLGIGTVYAALKGGSSCEIFPVPGVVDCEREPCLRLTVDATEAEFKVRKPGDYAFCFLTMVVNSGLPVAIDFESFGDLQPVVPDPGINPISAWYATTEMGASMPPESFLTPADFNNQMLMAPGDEIDFGFSIWTKLLSEQVTTACEYENTAIISLTLQNSVPYNDARGGETE